MASVISASTTSGTALSLTADTSGVLEIKTGVTPTTAMTIDGSQNVGIGTSSPSQKLHVVGNSVFATTTNDVFQQFNSTGGNFYIGIDNSSGSAFGAGAYGRFFYSSGAYPMAFFTNATERMRIDSSGNVGIGVTPAASTVTTLQLGTSTFSEGGGATSLASNTVRDTTWKAINTGTSGLYQIGGDTHYWYTAASVSAGATVALTEHMRITSGGYLKASNTGAYFSATDPYHELRTNQDFNVVVFSSTKATGNIYGPYIAFTGQSPNNTISYFLQCADTVERATIRSNGGLANYSANDVNLSDRREKTNFAPAKSYLDTICSIPVQTFNYIDQNLEEDGGLTLGVVAQDVQSVAPELVMESNWAGKDQPEKMRLSIYQTDLQYALMKCIQELNVKVEAQAAEIAALKGAQ